MNVYLVRHAEAADKAFDPDRNLTERGQQDAIALADVLRPLRLRVRSIWHSSKPRAIQTAQAIAPAVECTSDPLVEHSKLSPFAPVKKLARTLDCMNDDVMIVGHEPHLGRLAARLVTGHASTPMLSLDKPGVACLHREPDGQWRVAWMLSPELFVTNEESDNAPAEPTVVEMSITEIHAAHTNDD